MTEQENEQLPENLSPPFDELTMDVALELSDELLMRAGTILADNDGVVGEKEEKQLHRLLKEFNERAEILLAQKQKKVKR